MKKLLYGTTALAAAGMIAGSASAADRIKMGVGGYFQAFFVAGSEDDGAGQPAANRRSHKVSREGELIFNGKTTLDNGIQFGVQVQLEAETCGDQIDESFMWVSGSFGRVNIGSENSASYLMHYASPAPSHWAHGLNSPNMSHAAAGGGTNYPHTNPNLTSDSEKITYFTPRLAGFQLGASYTPENCEEANARNGASPTAPANQDCAGTYAGFASKNDIGEQSEVIELGANYVNKLGNFDIAISGSWGKASLESDAAAPTFDDREEWTIGARFGIAGFTFGGAYRKDDQGLRASNSERTDYNLGVRYATGPWGVGIQWAHVERERGGVVSGGALLTGAAATGDNETDAIELGGSYALGPGIVLSGGLQYWDHQSGSTVAATKRAQENEATIFFIGSHLAF